MGSLFFKILYITYIVAYFCPRGETDITTVFETVIPGSSPGEGTPYFDYCGYFCLSWPTINFLTEIFPGPTSRFCLKLRLNKNIALVHKI